jgi:hypothetical protein
MQAYHNFQPKNQAAKPLRAAHATQRGTLLTRKHVIITSAGRAEVLDDGQRWIPGEAQPKDRGPNPLLALCRNAEAHERHVEEERDRSLRDRRRAA